ncbi:MAG: PAC2 family protein [candidate division NC10 bacterium]|nr:PAC2 family protein [candidate division NC10 bacterium]
MASALTVHEVPERLRRPVLLMAFAGWNDASEAATTAARTLARAFSAEPFATIEPEEFYHFGLSRPHIRFKEGSRTEREVLWPATEFFAARAPDLDRDLVIGVAIEPHLKWKTYCGLVLELARRCEVSLVLTLGARLADVPHTRPIRLTGMASDRELAAMVGISPTRYEGPTGIVGVLNAACREQGMATASLWANVPHYISGAENPRAALTLVRRVAEFLHARVDLSELEQAAGQFEQNLAEVVAKNAEIAAYVRKLEERSQEDEPPAAPREELPPTSDVVAEIEQFLRQHRPEKPAE